MGNINSVTLFSIYFLCLSGVFEAFVMSYRTINARMYYFTFNVTYWSWSSYIPINVGKGPFLCASIIMVYWLKAWQVDFEDKQVLQHINQEH